MSNIERPPSSTAVPSAVHTFDGSRITIDAFQDPEETSQCSVFVARPSANPDYIEVGITRANAYTNTTFSLSWQANSAWWMQTLQALIGGTDYHCKGEPSMDILLQKAENDLYLFSINAFDKDRRHALRWCYLTNANLADLQDAIEAHALLINAATN